MNDIGESLQSEQLHEREEGGGGGKRAERDEEVSTSRERGGRRSTALPCKTSVSSCIMRPCFYSEEMRASVPSQAESARV